MQIPSAQSRKKGNPEGNPVYKNELRDYASIQRMRIFLHALIRGTMESSTQPAFASYSVFYATLM